MKNRMLFSLIVVFLLGTNLLHAELFTASAAVTALAVTAVCPPAGAVVTVAKVVACGLGAAIIYFAKKKKPDSREQQLKRNPHLNHNCPCGGEPPEHEDDEEIHPNGKYKDSPYHQQNSNGPKSPCPIKGQEILDVSLEEGGNSFQRVGVEGNWFVIFKKTGERLYHGYLVAWKELTPGMRKALEKAGFVTRKGKIIKQMINRK